MPEPDSTAIGRDESGRDLPGVLSGRRGTDARAEAPLAGATDADLVPEPPPPPSAWRASAAILVGTLLLIVATLVLNDRDAIIRTAIALIGLGALYRGYAALAHRWRGPLAQPALWLCTAWLILIALAAAFADFLPFAESTDPSNTLGQAGFQRPDLFSSHPLGTNKFALDLLGQSILGARVSLLTSLLAVLLSTVVGVVVGVLAGYFRGPVDLTVTIGTDSLLSFPPLILLVALAAIFGVPESVTEAVLTAGLALAVVGIPTMVRLARANAMVFVQREFVLASRSMGATGRRVMFKELLPNVLVPVASYGFIIVAVLIIAEGSLSFLGLGLQQPQPTWGNMIAEADLTVLRNHPHVALVPGIVMFLTVYAFNQVGEWAQGRWGAVDTRS